MKVTRIAGKTDQTDCNHSFNNTFNYTNYTSSICKQGIMMSSLWYCGTILTDCLHEWLVYGRKGFCWRLQIIKTRQKKQGPQTYGPIACSGWGLHMAYLNKWNKENGKSSVQNQKILKKLFNFFLWILNLHLQASLSGLEIEWFSLYVRSTWVSHYLLRQLT